MWMKDQKRKINQYIYTLYATCSGVKQHKTYQNSTQTILYKWNGCRKKETRMEPDQ